MKKKIISVTLIIAMLMGIFAVDTFVVPDTAEASTLEERKTLLEDGLKYLGGSKYKPGTSGVHYSAAHGRSGLDSTTSNGATVSWYRDNGLSCSNFVTFMYFNYLKNDKGIDLRSIYSRPDLVDGHVKLALAGDYYAWAKYLEDNGLAKVYTVISQTDFEGAEVFTYKDKNGVTKDPTVGSFIMYFDQEGITASNYRKTNHYNDVSHVAIYGGTGVPSNGVKRQSLAYQATYYAGCAKTSASWINDGSVKVAHSALIVDFDFYPPGKAQIIKTAAKVNGGTAMIDVTNLDGVHNDCYGNLTDAVYTVYSDSACTNKVTTLKPEEAAKTINAGTYYVKETTTPKGFHEDTTIHTLTVEPKKTAVLKVSEVPKLDPIQLLLTKVDKKTGDVSARLEGAEYTIRYFAGEYTKDSLPDTARRKWVMKTDAKGEIRMNDEHKVSGTEFIRNEEGVASLPYGTVTIQETKAPKGYVINSEVKLFVIKEGNLNIFTPSNAPTFEEEPFGALKIKKVDQNGESLEGATFSIYEDKELKIKVGETISGKDGWALFGVEKDKNGKESFTLIPDKTYYIKETATPSPEYTISTKTYSVKIVSGEITPIKDPVINLKKGAIGIKKVDQDDKPLAGVVFGIYRNKECTDYFTQVTTKENGEAIYGKNASGYAMTPGVTWYFKEISTVGDHVLSTDVYPVTVISDDVAYAKEKAINLRKGGLSIRKVSQNNKSLEGAEFTIYSDAKCTQKVKATDELPNPIITASDGWATYGVAKDKEGNEIYSLLPNTTYYLKETKAPKGCIMSDETFKITIVSGQNTPAKAPAVNKFPTGKIGINKIATTFSGITEGKVVIDGKDVPIFTPNYVTGKLEGATVEIRAEEDIITPDGVKVYSKDQLVDKLTTKDTTVYSKELALGKYYVKETFAPSGYLLYTEVKHVTLTADENLHVVNPITTIINERIKTSILLKKAAEEPKNEVKEGTTKVTIDKKPGEGFMFGLFADEDISLNGKVVIPKDSLVLTGKTDAKGQLLFTQDVPFGKYYVKELALPEKHQYPWKKDTRKFPVDLTVGNAKEGKIEIEVFQNLKDGELLNSLLYTKISKTDIVSGEPIEGATITIKDSNGKVVFIGTTNKNGDTDKIYLPSGTYTFTEESAPNGYIKTDEEFKFTIGEDGKVTGTIKFTNEPVPEVKTTAMFEDDTKDSLPKKEITLIDKVEATNLVIGKEYTVKGTLVNQDDPTEIIATGETKFTATAKDMTVEVKFTFDGSKLEGTTTVVFEDLYRDGKKVATHTEISDEDQTTRIPKIRTKVGESVMAAESKVTLKDTLTYTNLTPGNSYKVEGKLMDKETGKPVLINGKEVTSETKFTPKTEDGTVAMTFMFDASTLGGKSVVVFEKVIDVKTGVVIGSHEDINDTNQTVDFPKVETTAMFEDGSKEALPGEKTTVVDKVKATNLTIGKEYTVKGTLVNVEDEKDIIATAETTFKATEKNMVVDVVFTFDSSKLEGESIVVFEDLEHDHKTVATHSEINDKDQTVYFPEAKTKVAESEIFAGKVTLTDTITFKNLTPGEKYTAKGVLVDKKGSPIKVNGKEITSETEFIPGSENGTVDVTFEFDAKVLEGTSIVVFEEILNAKGTVVAEHKDVNDENQTATVVKVRTKVGESEILAKEVTLTDTLSYEGLTVGNIYKVKGVLVDKTGSPIKVDGKEITSETEFMAESKNGTVDVTFKFNAKALAGKSIVVFEELLNAKGEIIAEHKDTQDENQTFDVTEVRTKVGEAILNAGEVTLTDTITYKGLTPGETYTAQGILVDKTGNPIKVDGREITAETEFTPKTAEGTVDVVFKFNAKALEGTDIVVFEEVFNAKGTLVGEHKDTDDDDQTTTVTKARTKVGQAVIDAGEVTLTDTIMYEGLIEGETYTARGVLVDKAGRPIKADGKEITSETTFKAEKNSGTVDVTFTFDASALEGKSIVVFEEIFDAKGTVVAEHKDTNDENQTTTVSKLRTKISKLHMGVNCDMTLTDIIYYEGLTVGEMYTAKGVLVDKTGKSILVDGKEITSTATFTAEKSEGQVEVTFKFNGETLKGKIVVVFEEAYDAEGRLIGHHKDVNDKKQIAKIIETVETGDTTNIVPYFLTLVAAMIIILSITLKKSSN